MSNVPPPDPNRSDEVHDGQVPDHWSPKPAGGAQGLPLPGPPRPPAWQEPGREGRQWADQHRYRQPLTNRGSQQPDQQAQDYPRRSQATAALVMSIMGIFCCGVPGIPGMIMGRTEVKAIDAGLIDPSKRGTAQAAFIIGAITTGLMALGILFYVVLVIAAFGGS